MMRQIKMITILISFVLLAAFAAHAAEAPALVNYQGMLIGDQYINGNYIIEFRIWSKKSSQEDNDQLIWGASYDVVVNSGKFNVILGAQGGTPLPDASVNDIQFAFLDSERYLGVTTVSDPRGPVSNPQELEPRQRILSTPYALTAENGVPSGTIVMWNGTTVPTGWVLCDGTNGTPDLRDKFILSVSSGENPGATGGAHSRSLSMDQMPKHHHFDGTPDAYGGNYITLTTSSAGAHSHTINLNCGIIPGGPKNLNAGTNTDPNRCENSGLVSQAPDHSHTLRTYERGSGAAFDNRPAYYKLAFIMKL